MAETLTIRTASSTEVVKIAVPGPQGPKGDKGDPGDVAGLPLTTQGDTLYRGASQNERLPIGTSGQILKVSAGGIPEWGAAPATGVTSVALASSDLTITGSPITSSGTITANVTLNGLTLNKLETINTAHFLGRHGSGAGDVQPVSASQARTILNVADGAEANVQANWTEADSGSDAFIQNKPATFAPSAHSSSHAVGGSDPLFDQDLNQTDSVAFNELTVGGVVNFANAVLNDFSFNTSVSLKDNNDYIGTVSVDADNLSANRTYTLPNASGTLALTADIPSTFAASAITSGTLTHERGGLEADVSAYSGLVKISGGSTSAVGIGTGSTEVAAGDHVHGNLTSDGKIGSTSGLPVVTTTAGAVTTLALGTAGQVLQVNSGATGVEFAAASGGSGGTKTYATFTATDNNPPATDFATIDQRNSVACLDFSDTATESAVFVGVMPEGAVLTSGLIVRLHWMGTATTGNVRWSVAFERGNTDLDSDSFDTATAATATTNGTSGIVTVTAITCTNIDSIAAGDLFRLRVQRLGADAADSMIGAKGCELVAVEVRSAA